jgi:hypothetical protein
MLRFARHDFERNKEVTDIVSQCSERSEEIGGQLEISLLIERRHRLGI